MSLALKHWNQPHTSIDDDLQAHMEAHGNEGLEPEGEGGDENEEAEEPESASDDDPQEDDDDEGAFDEDAEENDPEAGAKYDVVERYNFVWSEVWMEGPTAYVGDLMTIYGSADEGQEDKPFECIAEFIWREYYGEFTCIYRPDTQTFTNFKAKRKTCGGGMELLNAVTVRMWEETWSKETGDWVRGRKETKDDRGHLVLFVQMHHEGRDASTTYVYGKKVVEDDVEKNAVLTEGEKERLRLPKSEYRDV